MTAESCIRIKTHLGRAWLCGQPATHVQRLGDATRPLCADCARLIRFQGGTVEALPVAEAVS